MKKDHEQEEKQLQELQHNEADSYWKKIKRYKVAIFLTLAVIGIALSVTIGVQATSTNTFCASCHMMTPQALTWEASSHSSIKCKDCHINPGLQGTIDAKIGGLYELYHMVTDSYGTPIRMHYEIPNENCTQCHNMNNRDVSPSGDLIVDHFIHDEKEISCVTCHDGVAHGKVSELRITYRSDFERWDENLAAYYMNPENPYSNPQMDKCMDCHELRNAPLTCETCHTTGMVPDDHKDANFLNKQHGRLAAEDLASCHTCHSNMSDHPIKEFQDKKQYTQFLNPDRNGTQMTVRQYAQTNTFCIDCHSQAPESHGRPTFFINHGGLVEDNRDGCLTCHANERASTSPVTSVTCASCHSGGHPTEWQRRHPTPIAPNQRIDLTCLECHVEQTCTSCHVDAKREQ